MATAAAPGRATEAAGTLPTELAIPVRSQAEPPPAAGSQPRTERVAAGASASDMVLPSDLIAEAGRRLSTAMLIVAAVDLVYALFYVTIWSEYAEIVGQVVGGGALFLSLGMAYMLRTCPRTQREVLLAGMIYEVLVTFGFSLVE